MKKAQELIPPVALIAPYPEMAELAREICREFDKPVAVEVGDLQEGLKKAILLSEKGVEVLISRGGTARLLKQELTLPIVEIQVSAFDILRALKRVSTHSQKIGIIGFGNVVFGSDQLADLLNLDLKLFIVQSEREVPQKIEEARKEKVDVIIGDKIVVSQSQKMGVPSVLIESGKEAILQSFHEAYRILEVVRTEAEKSRQYLSTLNQLRAVLNSVDDQIVLLDREDRIQSCNPAALQFLKMKEDQIKGKPLFIYPRDPLKEMKKDWTPQRNHLAFIQGRHLLLDYLPVGSEEEKIGTLIIGRSISKLQQAERKVRNELYLKGHVARYTFSDIVTEDEAFKKVIQRAKSFSRSPSTVLIQGETGTGKEMFAQGIHWERFGRERPFVAINCATLPEPLLESELFGYAPGAFTGARREGKKGLFELAHGGTLLLDEISELPLNLQSRLLRVIEEKEVQPIGDDRVIPVDVRIIATTNKDLSKEVEEKRFRGDLFYRLNVLQLSLPPLRERGRDPFVLFKNFVQKINPKCSKRAIFKREIENLLCSHSWPGNVRELKNLVERLAHLTENFTKDLMDLYKWIQEELRRPEFRTEEERTKGVESLNIRNLEKELIKKISESSPLKKSDLARLLGISRTTLWKLLKNQ